MKRSNYWLVTLKGGHVGRNNYIVFSYPLYAESGKEAARIGRTLPRVKHDAKDAVLDVKQINLKDYILAKLQCDRDPYLHCINRQEQAAYMDELSHRIYRNAEVKKYKKRHSLRSVWNCDRAIPEEMLLS